jgi:DNA-binding Lrp family transcriptional regulator
MQDNQTDIIVLKFADSKVPLFKERRDKDYILCGDDNLYPEYLTYLFNKSAKHNAILNSKAHYVFGEGYENGDTPINRIGETLNDIIRKAALDVEIYGGFRLEVIWDRAHRVSELYHVDYTTIRKGKDGGFYFAEEWKKFIREDEIKYVPAFNPAEPVGSQIYAYDEYRPMMRHYPLPGYIGSNNYIETDIEISKFYLSSIRNGMMPSKMLQFYIGDPGEEKKKEIEARFAKKFSGAENAGKFVMVFNPAGPDKKIEISDLSGSELDKMFVELNKTVQQEIYAGHGITSPMLFGIKTEGQLGGSTELRMAYEIFQNTYAKPKAKALDREVSYLMGFAAAPAEYELRPTDPIGWQIPDSVIAQAYTPDEVRDLMGLEPIDKPAETAVAKTLNALAGVSPLVATKILDNLTKNEIRSLASLPPVVDGDVIPNPDGSMPDATLDMDTQGMPVNEHIKNLTGRHWQHIERIQRKFIQGKITEQQARMLLNAGYGLTDEQINTLLNMAPPPTQLQMAAQNTDDDILALFDQFGDDKGDYEVIKSKKVCFSMDQIEDDEEIYSQEAFRTITDLSRTEASIISLIKKDPRIPAKDIAKAIGQTEAYVKNKIGVLTKRGWIESSTEVIGTDSVDVRTIVEDKVPPTPEKAQPAQIFIKYSYEGPQDSRNRPFCAKMMQLNRLYSRREIELISERLGYSVFDRRGGFWNKGGEILPHCRHKWVSNIVVRKPSDK